jgi:hypothetical protein
MRVLTLGLLIVALPALLQAQTNQYEMRYGEPVDVTLTDLLQNPDPYLDRSVRTRGQLEMALDLSRSYKMRDTFGTYVQLLPVNDVAFEFEEMAKKAVGKEIEVTGLFRRRTSSDTRLDQTTNYVIMLWAFVGPPDKEFEKSAEKMAKGVRLEDLVTSPGKWDGKMVRVSGHFRGKNLFGDLPAKSERSGSDWVIKDELYAVWITNRKPKGEGFSLDASLKRDTGKWMEVVGRVSTVGGVTYIQAAKVSLGSAPAAAAAAPAEPSPPPPPRPRVPPVVVFALPLDGDREVPRMGNFQVQFSKDMDEDSFKGHVLFRYVGRPQPGDRDFDGLRMTYDGGHRALVIDPGDVLRPGRMVEVLLLPGIVDTDGMGLAPRDSRPVGPAVDVLRYQVLAF